jgi:hypothetical protein
LHVVFAIVLVVNDGQGRNRGTSSERRGASTSLVTEDGGGFHDEGLDNVKRKTELRCWPPPSCLETNRATLAFELAPNARRSRFVSVLCEKHTQKQRFAMGVFSCRIDCRRRRPARKTEAQKSRLNRARRHATLAG